MEFARKQLKKYGWSEGQGLGKNCDGISTALKPKLKFDNAGLGHNISEEYDNNWWQRLYNEAASNIVTNKNNEKITIKLKGDSIDITTKKRKKQSSHEKNEKYKGFVKISELHGTTEKICKDADVNRQHGEDSIGKETDVIGVTNDELFKICGGRTAHKGARHGLKMTAKLARIVENERKLMLALGNSNTANCSDIHEGDIKKKKKRKKSSKVIKEH